jgi:hypothetical protein
VGDERVASSRIQALTIHSELTRRGIRSEILSMPRSFDTRLHWKAPRRWLEAAWRRRDVLIFQKVESSRAARLARLARRMGTRIVFLQSDARESRMYGLADVVVVSSAELGRLLEPLCESSIAVIEDAIDLPREVAAVPTPRTKGLRVLWIGGRLNFPSLDAISPVLARPEFADLELVTVSDHPEAKVAWSPAAAPREIVAADLAVIPCLDTPGARAKSNNRLTVLMGAALPVIATPIPAYRAILEPGITGFLAENADEWAASLRALRDPALRRRVGQAARVSAWERYSPELIADRWEALLEEVVGRGPQQVTHE